MTDRTHPNVAAPADTFVNMACGELPPHPPGWDEWWGRHRTQVTKAIEEAQSSARRTVHYRLLKRLEAYGLLAQTKTTQDPFGVVVREISEWLDEDGPKTIEKASCLHGRPTSCPHGRKTCCEHCVVDAGHCNSPACLAHEGCCHCPCVKCDDADPEGVGRPRPQAEGENSTGYVQRIGRTIEHVVAARRATKNEASP